MMKDIKQRWTGNVSTIGVPASVILQQAKQDIDVLLTLVERHEKALNRIMQFDFEYGIVHDGTGQTIGEAVQSIAREALTS